VGLILRETLGAGGNRRRSRDPIAMLATRAVRSQLYGVSIAIPRSMGWGFFAICAVALLAGFLPARRAASVEPSRALRTE